MCILQHECALHDLRQWHHQRRISDLSFPAISIRQSMERPEAQDAGTIILTGFEPDRVLDSGSLVFREHDKGLTTVSLLTTPSLIPHGGF